jgi:hypothetical protein
MGSAFLAGVFFFYYTTRPRQLQGVCGRAKNFGFLVK